MVSLAFLLGIISFGFTWCIERWVAWNWEGFKSDSPLDNVIVSFLVIGSVEEGSKFLVVGISLVVSAFLHGLFDFLILISGQTLPHPDSGSQP